MKLTLFTNVIFFLFITLLFSSCKNLSSDTQQLGTDKITGKVTIEGILVTDANIKVDDIANWQTTTDANGNFKISTLSDGEHTLYVEKNLSSGEVIYYQTSINLTQSETDLGTIDFPKPVKINNGNPTVSAIPLLWEKTNSSQFKGYKVYRHEGLGVDDNNGELIYSTVAKEDSTFIDYGFTNGVQYSYRVYVLADDGKLSGSNTLSINSVPEINYVSNGRFEISSDGIKPDFWQTYSDGVPSYNVFTVDGSEYVDGKTSLKVNYIDSLIVPNFRGSKYSEISQKIFSNDFVAGKAYNLSFWIKSDKGQAEVRILKIGTSSDTIRVAEYFGPSEFGWSSKTVSFIMPENTSYLYLKISTKAQQSVNGLVKLWIDGLKLSPAE